MNSPVSNAALEAPHSIEAEECLLSCCLLDGSNTIAQCEEAGITGADFYLPANQMTFDSMRAMHAKDLKMDQSVLAEEMKASGQLEAVGGFPYITQIAAFVPTTAQAGYWIERIRDLSTKRELLRLGVEIAESCHDEGRSADEIMGETRQRLDAANAGLGNNALLARLFASRYDPRRRLPDAEAIFCLGSVPIMTRGNISTITAQPKAGKSSLVAAMLAATFGAEDADTFSVSGMNDSGQAVIHFDTEQPAKKHEVHMDGVLRRAGRSEMPAWLHSYSRKGASRLDLRRELEAVIAAKHREHGGTRAVILDGAADFVANVNAPEECDPFVTWLEGLAVKYNTVIICIIHLNPASKRDAVAKSRGHLGSQLQRKGETDLRLVKDSDNATTVFTDPTGTRGEPVLEKDGPRFSWDSVTGMHLSHATKQVSRDMEKAARLRELAEEVWGEDQSLRYTEITTRISKACGIKNSAAEEKVTGMIKFGVIKKGFGQWIRAT